MADDTEVEEEDKKEEPKEVKPLPDLDRVTTKHLSDLETKLRKEYASARVEDEAERTELRAQIEELQEEKELRQKANDAKEKSKDTESTMVLPPHDIPPQQPNPQPGATPTDSSGKKQSIWKRIW